MEICSECGHYMSDHNENGFCQATWAGCGYGQCEEARKFYASQHSVESDEDDEYDFIDPNQNPWILSDQDAESLAFLRRSH